MISHIEIDGFKSFEEFSLDLEPFTVLAGPNNSGKSNMLEAITLLRDLELAIDDRPLVNRSRGTGVELFHRTDDGTRREHFEIDAEVQLPDGRVEWPLHVKVSQNPTGRSAFDVETSIVHAGRWIGDLAGAAAWLRSWIMVNPEPQAMRRGASLDDVQPLAASGANLAAVIGRIYERDAGADFALDAQFVIGDLVDIRPILDERRNQWDFDLIVRGDRSFTPALVSDGTLRVLALLAALHDPVHRGVVMIEDVENGLHPEYQGRLCERLAARVADGERQAIVTTHSPVVVSTVLERSASAVVFLDQVFGPTDTPDGVRRGRHRTRARRTSRDGERGTYVPQSELQNYLASAGGR
jgi:predicted ATPase